MTDLFKEKGIKKTEQREIVFNALKEGKRPLTAEEIFKNTKGISLATVYRALDTFAEKGMIEKMTFEDSGKNFYELAHNSHRHYAVCLNCRHMEYVNVCPVHDINIDNFQITGHRLEIYGYCKDCSEKMKSENI